MVSPKQLEFSTPDGASHDTLSVRKSQRTPTSKCAASDEAGSEEKSKKRKIKKEKPASSVINRIWNSEDEVIILKGLIDYKAEKGMESKVEWEAFYPLVGDSITAKFSKEQIMSKIRKLRKGFLDHFEKIKQGIDSHSTTFSHPETYELAITLWEKNEAKNGQDMSKENEKASDENEAVENENTKEALNNESCEEVLKDQNEVANAEQLSDNGADAEQFNDNGADAEQFNDNGAVNVQQNECGEELLLEENEAASSETLIENGVVKTTEKVTEIAIAGKEASHGADVGAVKSTEKEKQNAEDEFANVQDAFETLLSHDLSDHRKSLQTEKLRKLESGTRRKLSQEWNAICARERNLQIRKFKFSAVLAEASKER